MAYPLSSRAPPWPVLPNAVCTATEDVGFVEGESVLHPVSKSVEAQLSVLLKIFPESCKKLWSISIIFNSIYTVVKLDQTEERVQNIKISDAMYLVLKQNFYYLNKRWPA
jgi:hypothetical protein